MLLFRLDISCEVILASAASVNPVRLPFLLPNRFVCSAVTFPQSPLETIGRWLYKYTHCHTDVDSDSRPAAASRTFETECVPGRRHLDPLFLVRAMVNPVCITPRAGPSWGPEQMAPSVLPSTRLQESGLPPNVILPQPPKVCAPLLSVLSAQSFVLRSKESFQC
jgi:hypothetical protein